MKNKSIFFLLLGVSFLIFSTIAEASIVYSGKLNLKGPNFSLDLNGDTVIDLVSGWTFIGGGNYTSTSSYDVSFNNNFSMRYLNDYLGEMYGDFPGSKAPLEYGSLISSIAPRDLNWASNSNDAMMWNTSDFYADPQNSYTGEWNNIQGKYLGFELTVEEEAYYGWIQFDTDSENNITLIDYAYENIPNTSIRAGVSQVPTPASLGMLCSGLLLFGVIQMNKRNSL
nr:hypothetical protein [uncultured Desulfobacter sp.]